MTMVLGFPFLIQDPVLGPSIGALIIWRKKSFVFLIFWGLIILHLMSEDTSLQNTPVHYNWF
jgi:hypothetical protein